VDARRGRLAVADPETDLAAHPAALSVALVVGQMQLLARVVGVERLAEDARARGGYPSEPAEEAPSPLEASEQSQVVAEHDDSIERAELRPDLLDRQYERVLRSAAPRSLDRTGRGVDRDDLVASLLEVERDPSRPG